MDDYSSIERGSNYPTLKRSPCDLNNEGPQAKYHKVHDTPFFDQNLKHFENIGTMNEGGVINEEELLYIDNKNKANSDDDNESSIIDSDVQADNNDSDVERDDD